MTLQRLATLVATEPTISLALADRADGLNELELQAPESLRPFLTQALATQATVLAVTATARESEDLVADLGEMLGEDNVAHYPAWETLPHERLSPRSDTVGRRLAVLRRLVHPGGEAAPVRVIVAPVRSVLQPQVKGLADLTPVELHKGEDIELDQVVRDLAGAAYARVDLVERRGEFAVRGGIVDVFPPTAEHPLAVALRLAIPGLLGTIVALFTNFFNDPSISGRTQDYGVVLGVFADNPWFGRGLFTFVPRYYRILDNQYLMALVELGIIGLTAVIVFFVVGFFTARGAKRRATSADDRHIALALSASLVGLATSYATFDAWGFPMAAGLTFLVVGMIGSAWQNSMRDAKARGADGPPGKVDSSNDHERRVSNST